MAVPQDPKDNDIQVQHPDPRPVLSVRASVPVAELASAQVRRCGRCGATCNTMAVGPAARPMSATTASARPRPTWRSASRWPPVPSGRVGWPPVSCRAGPWSAPGTWAPTIAWGTPTRPCRPGSRSTRPRPSWRSAACDRVAGVHPGGQPDQRNDGVWHQRAGPLRTPPNLAGLSPPRPPGAVPAPHPTGPLTRPSPPDKPALCRGLGVSHWC